MGHTRRKTEPTYTGRPFTTASARRAEIDPYKWLVVDDSDARAAVAGSDISFWNASGGGLRQGLIHSKENTPSDRPA
jgi:hypothetical protein